MTYISYLVIVVVILLSLHAQENSQRHSHLSNTILLFAQPSSPGVKQISLIHKILTKFPEPCVRPPWSIQKSMLAHKPQGN